LLKGIDPCMHKYALGFTTRDMRIQIDLLPGQADLTLSVTMGRHKVNRQEN